MFDFDKGRCLKKWLGIAGAVTVVLAAVITTVSGWVIWKWLRCMNTVQKSLPTIKKASALYIEKYEHDLEDEYSVDESDCIPF